MRITVRLFATLAQDRPGERAVEVEPGTTIEQIMDLLEVPRDLVTLIFRNGRHASPDTRLSDGDNIALFPPIGGG